MGRVSLLCCLSVVVVGIVAARQTSRAYPTDPPKQPVNPSGLVDTPNPRLGQPAQFDPAIMSAAVLAMEQKARMASGSFTGGLNGGGGDHIITPQQQVVAQGGNSPPLTGVADVQIMPVPRGQAVQGPIVGAVPQMLKNAQLTGLKSGPADNPFANIQPPAQAWETNPLAYAAPGVRVVHPSLVAAAAVMETSASPPMTSAYIGVQLPYHPNQAMTNGAQRAREYLLRSRQALRPGEGLGYGAGAFPPPHHPGIPPKFGGPVNGFATRYGAPGAGVAGGVRSHVPTPGFTPHGGTPSGLPIYTMMELQARSWGRRSLGVGHQETPYQMRHLPQGHPHLLPSHLSRRQALHNLYTLSPHFRSAQRWAPSILPTATPFAQVPIKNGPTYQGPSVFAPIPYPIKQADKEYWKTKMLQPTLPFGPGLITPKFEKDPDDRSGKRLKPIYFPGPWG